MNSYLGSFITVIYGIAGGGNTPPPGTEFIITENDNDIVTESGDNLITE
jgi:hypothetical protein